MHCGFYDPQVCDGVYESHVSFFVTAHDFQDARQQAKKDSLFQSKRMHVDGLQQVNIIDGCRVMVEEDVSLKGKTEIVSQTYRDLAPKKPVSTTD